jgi:hypothetical protein
VIFTVYVSRLYLMRWMVLERRVRRPSNRATSQDAASSVGYWCLRALSTSPLSPFCSIATTAQANKYQLNSVEMDRQTIRQHKVQNGETARHQDITTMREQDSKRARQQDSRIIKTARQQDKQDSKTAQRS